MRITIPIDYYSVFDTKSKQYLLGLNQPRKTAVIAALNDWLANNPTAKRKNYRIVRLKLSFEPYRVG